MGRANRASRRKGKARVTVWHRATIQRKLVRGAVEVTLQDEFAFDMSKPALSWVGFFFGFFSSYLYTEDGLGLVFYFENFSTQEEQL